MSTRPNIAKIIKELRKKASLSLNQLSRLSGVSVAHLGRIEQGQRKPSPKTLLKIAKPLGLDVMELLVLTGYVPSTALKMPEEERDKLRAELTTLLERIASDGDRVKEIVTRLLLAS